MSRVSPDRRSRIHGLVRVILDCINLGVFNVRPISANSLIVALVGGIPVLEGTIGGWLLAI